MKYRCFSHAAVCALVAAGALGAPAMFVAPAPALAQQVIQRDPRVIASLDNWGYDQIYRQGWSANRLLDEARVYGSLGDEIGSVENILIGRDGQILGIIAQVGGFWDIGDTHVFVPWDRVTVSPTLDRVVIPVTEENVEDYSAAPSYITRALTGRIRAVDDDLATGLGIWKATDLIDDYVYLGSRAEYGNVTDLIFNANGRLYAYVVNADAGWGGGYYALPYAYNRGWDPGLSYYDAPYSEREVRRLEPFDYDRMNPRVTIGTGAGEGLAERDQTEIRNRERREVVGSIGAERNAPPRQTTAVWSFRNVDGDRNLELTSSEFVRVGRDIFNRWDRNRDGRLTSNEFYSGAFNVFDANGDSRISEREFSNAWERWGRGMEQRVSFGDLDRNRDGFLTERDFRRGLSRAGFYEAWTGGAGGAMNERQFTSRTFDLWDFNRDRVLDNREFSDASEWGWF